MRSLHCFQQMSETSHSCLKSGWPLIANWALLAALSVRSRSNDKSWHGLMMRGAKVVN